MCITQYKEVHFSKYYAFSNWSISTPEMHLILLGAMATSKENHIRRKN